MSKLKHFGIFFEPNWATKILKQKMYSQFFMNSSNNAYWQTDITTKKTLFIGSGSVKVDHAEQAWTFVNLTDASSRRLLFSHQQKIKKKLLNCFGEKHVSVVELARETI